MAVVRVDVSLHFAATRLIVVDHQLTTQPEVLPLSGPLAVSFITALATMASATKISIRR